MKMEHHLAAPFDGTVTEIRVAVDDQVDNGAVLLIIEPDDVEAPTGQDGAND
jgi:biotin carboxyl carrier protein